MLPGPKARWRGRLTPAAVLLVLCWTGTAAADDAAAVEEAAVEEAPVDEAPLDEAPLDEAPLDEAPLDDPDLGGLGFGELGLGDEFELLAEEDVVVSAVRHAQRIEESPSAITVLTRKDIRQSGVDNVADLLRLVPGVDVFRSTMAQPAVGIRSNSTIAGDLMLVLVDGRNVLWPGIGQALWTSMPFDIESVERVEVIRGPGSSIYGANALQGVVNIVTRRSSDAPVAAEVTLAAAPGDTGRADVRVHGTAGDTRYWASAGLSRYAPFDRPWESDQRLGRGRVRVDHRFSDLVDAGLEVGLITIDSSFFTVIGDGQWSNVSPYVSARLEVGEAEVHLVVEQSDVDIDLDVVLAVSLDESSPPIELASLPKFESISRAAGVSAMLPITLFPGNRLTLGVDGKATGFDSDQMFECPEGVSFEDFDIADCEVQRIIELAGGAFLQDEWRLVESLTLTLGLRLDANTTQPRPGLSPRAALVWTYLPTQALRFSVGRAFRKPTYLETFAHLRLDPGPSAPSDVAQRLQYIFATAVGNDDLDYEVATSAELGWRGVFAESRLTVTADLFVSDHAKAIFMREDDLQVDIVFGLPQIPPGATIAFRNNEGRRRTAGGELALEVRPLEWLGVGVSYAGDFELSNDQLDQPYALEPEHRVIGSLRVDLPVGLQLGVDAFWVSAYADDVGDPASVLAPTTIVPMGAWTLMNARVAYAVATEGGSLEIGATVFNLLGARQREAAGLDLPQGGSYGGMRLDPRVSAYVRGAW